MPLVETVQQTPPSKKQGIILTFSVSGWVLACQVYGFRCREGAATFVYHFCVLSSTIERDRVTEQQDDAERREDRWRVNLCG
jgi:hypothetical protein